MSFGTLITFLNNFKFILLLAVAHPNTVYTPDPYPQTVNCIKFQIFLPSFVTDNAEIVFQSIFVLEMLLKIYGLGPSMYFRSTFNAFDFVVSF